ncbi:MAG: class F sortase [Streptosporangiales bacterium]|nr:class F sortase [Streptosporangiales bacterium]
MPARRTRSRFGQVVAGLFVATGLTALGVAGYQLAFAPRGGLIVSADDHDPNWRGSSGDRVLDRSRPTTLRVPRIDVRTDLVRLSKDGKGVLDAPKTGDKAGWYRKSATPGEAGTSVIAGHVDWTDGPAVFYELGELEPGDVIKVRRADGRRTTYTVHATRQYAKNDFPSKLVYGDTPAAQLRLITCGGAFSNGHYVDNIVVFAHLTDVG